MTTPITGHPSSFALDALALGGLGENEAAQLKAHLEGCTECMARWQEDRELDERFRAHVRPRFVAAQEAPRGRVLRWSLFVGPALAACLLVIAKLPPKTTDPEPPAVRAKGEALQLFGRRAGRVFAVRAKDPLKPGDEVRFVVQPAGQPYVLIASIDGAGKANVYYPFGGSTSAQVAAAPQVELPGSIVLDATPGPERVVALFSRRPLAVKDVTAALEVLGRGGPQAIRSAEFHAGEEAQGSIVIEKEVH
jgi:hypothetical protein